MSSLFHEYILRIDALKYRLLEGEEFDFGLPIQYPLEYLGQGCTAFAFRDAAGNVLRVSAQYNDPEVEEFVKNKNLPIPALFGTSVGNYTYDYSPVETGNQEFYVSYKEYCEIYDTSSQEEEAIENFNNMLYVLNQIYVWYCVDKERYAEIARIILGYDNDDGSIEWMMQTWKEHDSQIPGDGYHNVDDYEWNVLKVHQELTGTPFGTAVLEAIRDVYEKTGLLMSDICNGNLSWDGNKLVIVDYYGWAHFGLPLTKEYEMDSSPTFS